MENDIVYWIWLAERCGYGSKYFTKLYSLYRDPLDIYNLQNDEIMQLDRRFSENFKDKLCKRNLEKARAIYEYCEKSGIDVIPFCDERYPERLRLLEDPPIVLYCLGKFPDFNNKLCVGIVGTRKMSRYGRAAAYKFSYELSSLGVCVVSGLALGVDAAAACGAIEGGEPTAQILGCGVGIIYPKTHSRLREAVIKQGALISEYPPLEAPKRYYFPQRNRIISGLSQGLFVTECRRESGAMITANMAMAQGKELFAFPGNVGSPTAEGPNELLRRGAYAAISVEDIISHYKLYFNSYNASETRKKLSNARASVIDVVEAQEKYSIPDRCEENELINAAPWVGARYDPEGAAKMQADFSLSSASAAKEGGKRRGATPKIEQLSIEQLEQVNEANENNAYNAYNAYGASDGLENLIPSPLNIEKNEGDAICEARESTSAPTSTARDYGLDEKTAIVFEAIPCKSPVSVDRILCNGLSVSDIVTALTMLEIMGLVISLPGGLYIRK